MVEDGDGRTGKNAMVHSVLLLQDSRTRRIYRKVLFEEKGSSDVLVDSSDFDATTQA